MSESLAYDRASVRRYDHDGRLHIEMCNISKANICPYYGEEIPKRRELGLQPDRIYQLFRDPDELKKAAPTFNNIQLMQVHDPVTPDQPKQMKVVGSTGTDARFEAPYLQNSLAVWVQSAIDLIESDKKKQLSCAYHYDADMTPGVYEGVPYDGVMRNIRGNHVALVEEGRAGDDVVIGDELPIGLKGVSRMAVKTSGKALLVRGALAAYLKPKLAQDAKIDLRQVLLGTTALNYASAKPTIASRLKAATAGKLAKDATLEDMHGLLDSLDREGEDEEMDGMDEETEEEKKKREEKEAKDKAARDEEAETEEEREERMKRRKEAKDKAAKDKAAKDKSGRDETEEEMAKREQREAEDKAARDAEPKPVTKAAMDAAIAAAVQKTIENAHAVREAERAVKPWIGELAMAQDSAEAVYKLALNSLGVRIKDVHPSAYRAILEAQPKPSGAKPRMAVDAARAKTFAEANPDVVRIKIL